MLMNSAVFVQISAVISLRLEHCVVASVVDVDTLKERGRQKPIDLRLKDVCCRADRHHEREVADEMWSNLHILSGQNGKRMTDTVRSAAAQRRGSRLHQVRGLFRRIQ